MPSFVWVFGASASGKETLIKGLLNDSKGKLSQLFGWKDKRVISIPESLAFIGQYSGDPVTLKRSLIVEKAKQYSDDESLIVLIKGQDVDLRSKLPESLRDEIPSAKHEIIYLYSNFKTLHSRIRKKDWWKQWIESNNTESKAIEVYNRSIITQLKLLKKLDGFRITSIDSTTPEYRLSYFPLFIIEKLAILEKFIWQICSKLSSHGNNKFHYQK